MGRRVKGKTRVVNIAHYNALTGELNIYKNVRAIFQYNEMRFKDPKTGKQKRIYIWNAKDGVISIREQSAVLWSTDPIDPGMAPIDIDDFKRAVWDYRLEHYGHMVADALSIIRAQKNSLEKAYAVLCD